MRLFAIIPGLLTLTAAGPIPLRSQEGPPFARVEAERRLIEAKARIMSADYEANLGALARLREDLLPLADQGDVGYLASYWAGFASWRLAINGASAGMKPDELKVHLERALTDFEASIRKRQDFADAYAAAGSINGWLGGLSRGDLTVAEERWDKMNRLLSRARELEPNNPRVLWVVGGDLLFRPPARGGSAERAIEIYHRAVAASKDAGDADSPLPDWGKPEALMALAYAHLNQAAPDLAAASEEAQAALRLQPRWSYVRDILLPQIDAARAKSARGK